MFSEPIRSQPQTYCCFLLSASTNTTGRIDTSQGTTCHCCPIEKETSYYWSNNHSLSALRSISSQTHIGNALDHVCHGVRKVWSPILPARFIAPLPNGAVTTVEYKVYVPFAISLPFVSSKISTLTAMLATMSRSTTTRSKSAPLRTYKTWR